jgi:hypothetical protein
VTHEAGVPGWPGFPGRGHIQDHPVKSQLENGSDELAEIDGLEDVAVGKVFICRVPVSVFVGRSKNDDRKMPGTLLCAKGLEDIQSAEPRELQLKDHQRRAVTQGPVDIIATAKQIIKRLDTVTHAKKWISDSRPAESLRRQFGIYVTIFDQKNVFLIHPHCVSSSMSKLSVILIGEKLDLLISSCEPGSGTRQAGARP